MSGNIYCSNCGSSHYYNHTYEEVPKKCSNCHFLLSQELRVQLVEPVTPPDQPQLITSDTHTKGTMIFKQSFNEPVEGQLLAILNSREGLFRGLVDSELERLRERIKKLEEYLAQANANTDLAMKAQDAELENVSKLQRLLDTEIQLNETLREEKEDFRTLLHKLEKDIARLRTVFGEKAFTEALKVGET